MDPTSETPEKLELRLAIDGLYDAFAHHPLRDWTEPCLDCCSTEAEELALHAVPLRELTPDALRPYVADALSTWGDEADFAHFLPRVFEILASDDFGWPDVEILLGRLPDPGSTWGPTEAGAVDRYLRALWRHTLADDHPVHRVDDLLCGIGNGVGDIEPYLEDWLADDRPAASRHLVAFLLPEEAPTYRRLVGEWRPHPALRGCLVRWVGSAPALDRLQRIAAATRDEPGAPAAEAAAAWRAASED